MKWKMWWERYVNVNHFVFFRINIFIYWNESTVLFFDIRKIFYKWKSFLFYFEILFYSQVYLKKCLWKCEHSSEIFLISIPFIILLLCVGSKGNRRNISFYSNNRKNYVEFRQECINNIVSYLLYLVYMFPIYLIACFAPSTTVPVLDYSNFMNNSFNTLLLPSPVTN